MSSAVAGIIDHGGGLRVVVTQRWRMRHHVKKGERLFVVPGFKVEEPVPWEEIPYVIAVATKHVVQSVAPVNQCGDCTACCTTLYIKTDNFEKSSHSTCTECKSYGCGLYFNRPKPCRDFECSWLQSQSRNDVMGPELRPDKCGVIFTPDMSGNNDKELFEVHPDIRRPELLNSDIVTNYINEQQAMGRKAYLVTHYPDRPPIPVIDACEDSAQ